MKKALIHDWYTVYGGAERCVESFTNIWDDFDHFSLIDDLSDPHRELILKGKKTKNSFIQKLPFWKKKYRTYLPLFPFAIEQFDLSDYEFNNFNIDYISLRICTDSTLKENQILIKFMIYYF